MSLQTTVQAWKSQAVFVSILSGDGAVSWLSHTFAPASPSAFAACRPASIHVARQLSGGARRGNPQQAQPGAPDGSDSPPSSPSLWASIQRAIFPIQGSSKPTTALDVASTAARGASARTADDRGPPGNSHSHSSATTGAQAHGRATIPVAAAAWAAREAARDSRRAGRGSAEDAFTALSKPAERFSGTLLKAAVLLITVPFGVHLLSDSLLMSLCIRGLEADRPETVALTLRRVRSVVASDYLASRFESEDGVGLLLATFNERAPEAVLRGFLAAAEQLLKFKSTREALLMLSLVERLERAQASGWLPLGVREQAQQLYLDAHAARRMEMEEMGKKAAAGGSGAA